MPTRPNRIRPTLDALEAREVCWAGLPGLPLGGLSPIVHLGPVAPPAHQLHVADSVFSLVNRTSHALHLRVHWQGATAAQSYVLMPGESRPIWIKEIERFPAARTAVIRIDGGANGVQVFRVKAALTADGPNGPVGHGPVYAFRPGPAGGVTLHPEATRTAPAARN